MVCNSDKGNHVTSLLLLKGVGVECLQTRTEDVQTFQVLKWCTAGSHLGFGPLLLMRCSGNKQVILIVIYGTDGLSP